MVTEVKGTSFGTMFSAGLPATSPIVWVPLELGEKISKVGVLVPKIEFKLASKTELSSCVMSVSVALVVVKTFPPRSVKGETAIPYPNCGSSPLPANIFPPTLKLEDPYL